MGASRDEVGVSGCGVGSRSNSGSDWYDVVEAICREARSQMLNRGFPKMQEHVDAVEDAMEMSTFLGQR